MVTIVQKDDPILRQIAKSVPKEAFGKTELKKIIKDMKAALSREDDGVAIAAPQIGISLCIFVVSGRVLSMLYPEKTNKNKSHPDKVFINPKILKISKDKEILEEGCLSVRYLYGNIERAKKIKVKAFDEKGAVFEIGASGLLAQIFQHEIDHLKGELFIDKATNIRDIPPVEIEKIPKK